jgi:hypothetical protein
LPEIFIHDDDLLESMKNNSSILSHMNKSGDIVHSTLISKQVSRNNNTLDEIGGVVPADIPTDSNNNSEPPIML